MGVETDTIDVNAIGRRVTAIYEPVVENLTQVRSLARTFEKDVAALEQMQASDANPNGTDSAAQAGSALEALCDVISASVAAIGAAEVDEHLRYLETECRRLKNSGRELSALSSLMLITAANASDDFAVDSLVGELRNLSESLVNESDSIVSVVAEVNAVRKTSRQSLEEALALAEAHGKTMTASPETLTTGSKQPPGQTRLDHMALNLSRTVARIMPRIMACMQYPDAFAQRCDHAAQILDARSGDEYPADAHALAALGLAQINDMRRELDTVQKDTGVALEQIAEACNGTIHAFDAALQADRRLVLMRERQQHLHGTQAAIEDIKTETDEALADLSTCQTVFDKISGAFTRLNKMRVAVALSSLNADLSERQSEKNTPEIRSVTKAVGECAASCGRTIKALNRSFEALRTTFSGTERERLGEALVTVCTHLERASTEIDALSREVESIRSAQEACSATLTELVASARLAASQIASNSLTLKEMEQMEARLAAEHDPRTAPGQLMDAALAKRLFEGYTMEREREVHRAVLAAPDATADDQATAGTAEETEDDDPLAAVLF